MKPFNELLIDDIMHTLDNLHVMDFFLEDEVDSMRSRITQAVNNYDIDDLKSILEDLKENECAGILDLPDKALFISVIIRLTWLINEAPEEENANMKKYTVIYTDGLEDYTYTCITDSAESASNACYVECMEGESANYEQVRIIEENI